MCAPPRATARRVCMCSLVPAPAIIIYGVFFVDYGPQDHAFTDVR
jgi:hypothetical protein